MGGHPASWNAEPVGQDDDGGRGVGIVVNAVTAWLFASGRKDDINLRGAFLHMASDAPRRSASLRRALSILLTNWLWMDPVVSLVINAIIVWGTWGLCATWLACRWRRFRRKSIPRRSGAFY